MNMNNIRKRQPVRFMCVFTYQTGDRKTSNDAKEDRAAVKSNCGQEARGSFTRS